MEKQAAINSREETQRYRAPNLIQTHYLYYKPHKVLSTQETTQKKHYTLYVPALLFLLLILHNKDVVIVFIVALCYVASFPGSRAWASPSLSHKSLGTSAMVRD